MAGRMLPLALSCAALLAFRAAAQQPAAPGLQRELQQLGEAATALERALPNFTCQEKAVSSLLKGKKVSRSTEFEATLRAQRAADGTLNESFSVSEVNGKPFSTGHFALPIFVSGGFDQAMRYFAPWNQVCYRYLLLPGRIDFTALADPPKSASCKEATTHGFALLDADGNVTRVERRVELEAAQARHEATYATVDFAAVQLNGRTYRLSQHLYAEVPINKHPTTFTADYSDCKLFTATVTLHTAPDPAPDSGSAPETLPH